MYYTYTYVPTFTKITFVNFVVKRPQMGFDDFIHKFGSHFTSSKYTVSAPFIVPLKKGGSHVTMAGRGHMTKCIFRIGL
jgi:hypothetical protein